MATGNQLSTQRCRHLRTPEQARAIEIQALGRLVPVG